MIIELNEQNFDAEIKGDLPVLVDFWAAWCGPCRMQSPVLDKLDSSKVKVCKVNVDQNPSLSAKFGIVSIPTMILFKGGVQKDKLVGLHNLTQLEEKINRL